MTRQGPTRLDRADVVRFPPPATATLMVGSMAGLYLAVRAPGWTRPPGHPTTTSLRCRTHRRGARPRADAAARRRSPVAVEVGCRPAHNGERTTWRRAAQHPPAQRPPEGRPHRTPSPRNAVTPAAHSAAPRARWPPTRPPGTSNVPVSDRDTTRQLLAHFGRPRRPWTGSGRDQGRRVAHPD
jgi:hypothetical protein